jgi:hypothetical protein
LNPKHESRTGFRASDFLFPPGSAERSQEIVDVRGARCDRISVIDSISPILHGRMIAVLTLCLLGQSDDTLTAITKAWEQRYQQVKSVDLVAEGDVVTTPDFLAGLAAPKRGLEDKPLPVRLEVKIDFKKQMARVRREEHPWNVPKDSFEKIITEFTVTPAGSWTQQIDPSTGKRGPARHDIFARDQLIRIDVLPVWLNNGVVYLGDPGASPFGLPDYDAHRKSRQWSIVSDRRDKAPIIELAIAGPAPTRPSYMLGLDPNRQFAVQSLVEFDAQGRVTIEVRIAYHELEGRYLPRGWTSAAFSGGKLLIHEDIRVKRFETNIEIPESAFVVADGD